MRRLEDKVILVAGGGSIGNECARRYASEGASVVLGDVRPDIAQIAIDDITKTGGKAVGAALNGGDQASIKAFIELGLKTYGGIDGLHCNYANVNEGLAGTNVTDVPMEIYDDLMQTNARGFFLLTRFAIPHIIERGGGAIIYTSSGSATSGEPTRVTYAMTKAATQALMRHVALRFGENGIRANAVAPGVIERPKMGDREATPDVVREIVSKKAQIKRLGRPTDIASMCTLLLSDEGSYITGQIINIDGGITMRP